MVPHAGHDSRVFREVCELGATLQDLAPVRGSRGGADIAILYDWESQWAQDLPWRPSVDLGHRQQTQSWYERLWRGPPAAAFGHPAADRSGDRTGPGPAVCRTAEGAARRREGGGANGGQTRGW